MSLLAFPLLALQYKTAALDDETRFLLISRMAQLLLPVLVVWWVYFALRERIEGDGREVLWVYRAGALELLVDLLLIWLWYALHMACAMLLLVWFPAVLWSLYLHLLLQSVVYVGLFCLIAGLSGSAGAGFLIVLAYYFASAFFTENALGQISLFLSEELLDGVSFLRRDLLFAGCGVVAAILGGEAMRRRRL